MTLPTGNKKSRVSGAFTLIELILIMAVLVIAVSLITPRLSGFFKGRALDSEVERFMSLARYGQNRAVSEGVPMMLWIDSRNGTYGLQQEIGYTDSDQKAVDFTVDKDLQIDVARGGSKSGGAGKLPAIHFSPDGTIVSATSVTGVSLRLGKDRPVWIVPSANRLGYEIQG